MPLIDTPITANSESLEKVLATSLPQLLLLHHELTDLLDGTFKRIAKTEAGKLLTVKVNLNENPAVALAYNPSEGTPLLVALKEGKEVARRTRPTAGTMEDYAAYLLGKTTQIEGDEAKVANVATKPITVTDENFVEKVLQSDKPVLVDFWATWCPPCRMIAPTLEKMAGDLAGQLIIAKLDVDNNPMTAMQYQVQSIPTLLLFKGGQIVNATMGAQPEAALRQFVQPYI